MNKNKFLRVSSLVIIGVLYVISVGNFLNIYFYQFPLQAGVFEPSQRLLTRYISFSENQQRKISIFSPSSKTVFKNYLFYSNAYTNDTGHTINAVLKQDGGAYHYQNISFQSCPGEKTRFNPKDLIAIDATCGTSITEDHIAIAQFRDSGARFFLINDTLCKGFHINHYISGLQLSDMNIENIDAKRFCETFIVD